MGNKTAKGHNLHGYEWQVADQQAYGYFDKALSYTNKFHGALAKLFGKGDMKKTFGILSENFTGNVCKALGSGGNLLVVTNLVMDVAGLTTNSTEDMIKNMEKLLKKMDKKLDTIRDFQDAFHKGFAKGKFKNTFNYLLEYDERKDSKYLVDSLEKLTDFLTLSTEVYF